MNSYIEYKNKKKRYNLLVKFTQIFILIFFIVLWQFLSDNNYINSFIFSNPKKVFLTIIDLYQNGSLLEHIWITTYETLISFALGTVIGITIATLMWLSTFFAKVINPYLTVLNSLPKVALGPIIIIWFGSSINSIIIMALLISTIITIINVYQAFISIDKTKLKLLQTFKASKSFTFINLILPGSINVIVNTLIINISMSLIGLLPPVGEKIFFNKCYSRY